MIKNRLSQFFLATEQKFVYNTKMTKREKAEVINKLKFKITKEILLRNKIIANWSLKIPFDRKQITPSKAKAFIKARSPEDKEEGIKSVELFDKNVLINNSESFEEAIRENK